MKWLKTTIVVVLLGGLVTAGVFGIKTLVEGWMHKKEEALINGKGGKEGPPPETPPPPEVLKGAIEASLKKSVPRAMGAQGTGEYNGDQFEGSGATLTEFTVTNIEAKDGKFWPVHAHVVGKYIAATEPPKTVDLDKIAKFKVFMEDSGIWKAEFVKVE